MTNVQIIAIQSYILACVRYEAAHHSEKSEALMTMITAQNRMHDLLLDKPDSAPVVHSDPPEPMQVEGDVHRSDVIWWHDQDHQKVVLKSDYDTLGARLAEVEQLAAGNITCCGTCSTVLRVLRAADSAAGEGNGT